MGATRQPVFDSEAFSPERKVRRGFPPGAIVAHVVRTGPSAFKSTQLSGGSIAEMPDQTATHCCVLVAGCPCPTLSMTITILRAGNAKSYVATGRVLKLMKNAVLAADLDDDAETPNRLNNAGLTDHHRYQPAGLSGLPVRSTADAYDPSSVMDGQLGCIAKHGRLQWISNSI
ncbi:hypothetical protein [Mycobacterium sp. 1482292.6]|uniref:hypothetical protein n=1 Tax=Mycobacterium sp. 1482292.6 TaxID=1834081 RepID=UPI0012E99D21|nr:hypothetical protein [Mycobacterium sp. 1482292.6]